jgi:phospholipase/carboxylesterase
VDAPQEAASMPVRALVLALAVLAACQDSSPRKEPAMTGPTPPRVITVAAQSPPSYLLVLLHGVGASADDLAPLASALAPQLPGVEILVPDGIAAFDSGPSGRQWFSIRGVTEDNRTERVQAAATAISAWLDRELEKRKLSGDKLLLLGFSQGAIVSNYLVLARHPAPRAVVSLSGRLAVPADLTTTEHPRVLVSHGSNDPVIAPALGREAAQGLEGRGATVSFQELPGLGHGIDQRVVQAATKFLVEAVTALAQPPTR